MNSQYDLIGLLLKLYLLNRNLVYISLSKVNQFSMFTGQFVGEPLLIICMYAAFVAQIKNLLNYNYYKLGLTQVINRVYSIYPSYHICVFCVLYYAM